LRDAAFPEEEKRSGGEGERRRRGAEEKGSGGEGERRRRGAEEKGSGGEGERRRRGAEGFRFLPLPACGHPPHCVERDELELSGMTAL